MRCSLTGDLLVLLYVGLYLSHFSLGVLPNVACISHRFRNVFVLPDYLCSAVLLHGQIRIAVVLSSRVMYLYRVLVRSAVGMPLFS